MNNRRINSVTPESAARHAAEGLGPVCDTFVEQPEPSAYWCGSCHWNRDIHGDETSIRNIAAAIAAAGGVR